MTRAGRSGAAARLELRVQSRYQVVTVAAVLAVVWALLLALVPEPGARTLGPYVLVIDTATFGTSFMAALVLMERGEGALAALAVSPLRPGEYLGVKLATLAGLSLVAAVPITLAAGRGQLHGPSGLLGLVGLVALGVGLAATLLLTLSFLLVLGHRSLTGYLAISPLLLVPLLVTPLAHLAGVLDHPLAYAVPTTGAADLIRGGMTPRTTPLSPLMVMAIVAYLLLWTGLAIRIAVARLDRVRTRPRQPRAGKPVTFAAVNRPSGRWSWLRTFCRVDLRSIRMDLLLVLVLTAPVLLATALRLGYRPLVGYLGGRFGIDLAPHTSLLLMLLVVVHVPIIVGMVGALLVLDDLDERRLALLRVTPVTLERYLAYRIASTTAAALGGLLLTVPLAGLGRSPPPALLLAAAQAPLIMLAVAAFARNKVQGIGLLKLLSGLIMLAASTPWWLPTPLRWPLLALPPAAAGHLQQAAQTGDAAGLLTSLAAGAAATLVIGAALSRRAIRQLTT